MLKKKRKKDAPPCAIFLEKRKITMKLTRRISIALCLLICISCSKKSDTSVANKLYIQGTWKLISNTIYTGDKVERKSLQGQKTIKIINENYFSFLTHDVKDGQDPEFVPKKVFVAGGGPYVLEGSRYTETLEFCSARQWENNDFSFEVEVRGDTLFQIGMEVLKDLGVNQKIEEIYIRIK